MGKLRISLEKFEQETEMFNKFKDEELNGAMPDRESHEPTMDKLSEEETSAKTMMIKIELF